MNKFQISLTTVGPNDDLDQKGQPTQPKKSTEKEFPRKKEENEKD